MAVKGRVGRFPGGAVGKELACNAGDVGSIPGLARSPGEGNGNPSNPFQYSCLGNSMDRGGQSTGSQELDTTERLKQEQLQFFLVGSHAKLCDSLHLLEISVHRFKVTISPSTVLVFFPSVLCRG